MGIHDNVYTGKTCVGMVMVGQEGRQQVLPNRKDLKNYTPDSGKYHPSDHFDWGCDSPACYQLGLSILANEFGDSVAMNLHRAFTEEYICKLDGESNWTLNSDDLERAVMRISARG